MTALQRLQLRASEVRQRLNELANHDGELTAEQRQEVDTLTAEYRENETRQRAASVASDDAGESTDRETVGDRVQVGAYLRAAVEGTPVGGAEAEFQAASGLAQGSHVVPWEAIRQRQAADDGELRERADAVTAAPAAGNRAADQQETLMRVFPASVSEFMRVRMPMVPTGESVYPVLTGGAAPATLNASQRVDAVAAAFDVSRLSPQRLTAHYRFRREDAASFAMLEGTLREDLSMAMSDAMDRIIVRGQASSTTHAALPGLLDAAESLTAPGDPAAVTTWKEAIQLITDRVDGRYAATARDVRLMIGADVAGTYGYLSTLFAPADMATNGAPSAAEYLRMLTADQVRVSGHVEVAGGTGQVRIQGAVAQRGMASPAVAPVWEGVTLVRDEVTAASSGEVIVTMIALWSFAVVRADQFARLKVRTA